MTGADLPPLAVDDFAEFFAALWAAGPTGGSPFPWQIDLVSQVARDRRWPDLVDLPTGTGKTSLLDIAVFLQALEADLPPTERWMPRRIVLVVDRRVIVDQADVRGGHIRRAVEGARDGVLLRVAQRLRHLSRGGPPLVTSVLRGGIVRDESWAQRPDVPALVSSTVDQVGSRLLFRGYGLSPSMQPIHAGLLANDTLFLLDEVHLAQPFAETLDQIAGYRQTDDGVAAFARWQVVQLTATPTGDPGSRFPAAPLDPSSHPVLGRRLLAAKPAELDLVKVPKEPGKAADVFAQACVRHAQDLMRSGPGRTLGVIVNRVDTARRVAHRLTGSGVDVCLLTGRMRPADRDRLLAEHGPRLRTGRVRSSTDEPLVVVATQSIEAGADFDLDGIVTECASLDALRQRFGRVDRDGMLSAAGTPARSVIVARSTDVTGGEPDPVYGRSLARTWSWLRGLAAVDFGATRLVLPEADTLAGLAPSPDRAPLLLPTHLDQLVQRAARPAPAAEPDVGRWLHGLAADERTADVELVWRSDIDATLLDDLPDGVDAEAVAEGLRARLAACPPTGGEALPVPVGAFRRWVVERREGQAGADLTSADAPTASGEEPPARRRGTVPGRYLRWTGTTGEIVSLGEIRPGDTVVLPATFGGIGLGNWDPTATDPVEDLAAGALAARRRLAVARLRRACAVGEKAMPDPRVLAELRAAERDEAIREVLRALADESRPGIDVPSEVAGHLARARSLVVRAFPEAVVDGSMVESYVVWSKEPMPAPAPPSGDAATDDGDDAPSFTGVDGAVSLVDHLDGVGAWAGHFAENLGWPAPLVADVRLAGLLHDAGKADPRFQRWLHDGDELAAASAGQPLAKSAVPDSDRVRRRLARSRSGYPSGARHEMLSLAMAAGTPGSLATSHDADLVGHLVASHHGYARYRFDPVAPGGDDASPPLVELPVGDVVLRAPAAYDLVRLDRGVPDRFWRLVRRYGWFLLVTMEAVLRLADHERSRRERDGVAASLPSAGAVTNVQEVVA